MAKNTFSPPHQEKLGSQQVIHDKVRERRGEQAEKGVGTKGLRPEPELSHTSLLHVSAEGLAGAHRQCWGHTQGGSEARCCGPGADVFVVLKPLGKKHEARNFCPSVL